MKVMTILGTRPEIIRLASVLKKLDKYCDHVLVHTGQNYDYNLNKVFFEDLELREPDHILSVRSETLHGQLSNIISQTGDIINKIKPDALLVLGDTNSALSVINAKRLKIPIYHMEAGDRSFDEDVPEELNRRLVDHTSDVLLPYTETSRRNLLREGIHPQKIFVTGSPIKEVYDSLQHKYLHTELLDDLGLKKSRYFVASIHREENVDKPDGLAKIVNSFNLITKEYGLPLIVSTHPRTKMRLQAEGLLTDSDSLINWHEPFGLLDFLNLQTNAYCVISDSGTIHEDSSVLGFPAVAIRKSTEKAESIDAGHCIITGLAPEMVLRAIKIAVETRDSYKNLPMPVEYDVADVSTKIIKIILGMNTVVKERVWGIK
ncbi:UDP-N-acetylglucosamine 2-epimerase (non-hydrolyzing) [Planktomarina temperata]|nr:UDP-N-acetylglucosamine 2-epimerase (non-hydrolyzing) [bacterium]MDB2458921.1 UDP-N-acetylglucosamine 2-epimerase (non-hydrolyzing) [Planktomarina temperata]